MQNSLMAQKKATDTNRVYTVVERPPVFCNGEKDELLHYFIVQVTSPQPNEKISRVVIAFIVEKDGTLSNIKINEGKENTPLGQEIIRIAKTMPKWAAPGYQHGEPVRVQYALPISFKKNQ
jgi:TonB family protein